MKIYEHETTVFRPADHWDAIELAIPISCGISGPRVELEIEYAKTLKEVEFQNKIYFRMGEKIELTDDEHENILQEFLNKMDRSNDYDDNN